MYTNAVARGGVERGQASAPFAHKNFLILGTKTLDLSASINVRPHKINSCPPKYFAQNTSPSTGFFSENKKNIFLIYFFGPIGNLISFFNYLAKTIVIGMKIIV